MKTYRCKHAVEAMRWIDTDDNREAFATWFESHDAMFETRGPVVVLPNHDGSVSEISEGEWIMFSDGEFITMEDELFVDTYEPSPVSAVSPGAIRTTRDYEHLQRLYKESREYATTLVDERDDVVAAAQCTVDEVKQLDARVLELEKALGEAINIAQWEAEEYQGKPEHRARLDGLRTVLAEQRVPR